MRSKTNPIRLTVLLAITAGAAILMNTGCIPDGNSKKGTPVSDSGVAKASVKVQTDADGYTTEQKNIMKRLARDNEIGAMKHLYVFSLMTGQQLFYSPIVGKSTSSNKRLSPTSVAAGLSGGEWKEYYGVKYESGGTTYRTNELTQDDGTYGSSSEYFFWFDEQDRYMKMWIEGTAMVIESDTPLAEIPQIVLSFQNKTK